jgi:hypothetical protein
MAPSGRLVASPLRDEGAAAVRGTTPNSAQHVVTSWAFACVPLISCMHGLDVDIDNQLDTMP